MIQQDNTGAVFLELAARARRGVQAATSQLETDVKLLAPVRTGHHRRSIYSEVKQDGNIIRGIVGHQSDYGGYLELGTRRMAARPHFRPAYDALSDKIPGIIARGGL